MKDKRSSKQVREKHSRITKLHWKDNRDKMVQIMRTSKAVAKSIKKATKVLALKWKEPIWRRKRIKQMKEFYDEESREKASRKTKTQWMRLRGKMLKANRSRSSREGKSKATKAMWKRKGFRKYYAKLIKQSWIDGIFDELGDKVKQRWREGCYDTEERKKAGNWGKSYFCRGIRMRSNWEKKFAKLLSDKRIKWKHEPKIFIFKNGKRYTPDFYLPKYNLWIEIKGWMDERSINKIRWFTEEFPNLKYKVLRGSQTWNQFIKNI
jgi:hypothetical protein